MANQILNEQFRRMQRLAGIITEEQYLNENIEQFEDYVSDMFNMSIPEDSEEGEYFEGVWEKEEYGDEEAYDTEEWYSLTDYLKSVGGKATLEGNPDIDLELMPNGDIKFGATVTLDEAKNLQEAEKTIQAYGPRLMDGLKKNGFDVKFVTNSNENDQLAKVAKTSDNKLAVIYYEAPTKFISITTNGKNQDEAFKVVDSPFVKELMPDEYSYQKQGGYFIEIQGK
jgi:hypothetical protein